MTERDFSAWRIDDKAWMAERKKGWKGVNATLRMGFTKDKDELALLKSYYLTGRVPEEWDEEDLEYERDYAVDRPLRGVSTLASAILCECWLSADTSDEAWQQVKQAYQKLEKEDFNYLWDAARSTLRNWALHSYPDEGTLFDGLDERLYHFFGPIRARREDFPQWEERIYKGNVNNIGARIGEALERFLLDENPNPNHIVINMVREWGDTIVPGQHHVFERAKAKERPVGRGSSLANAAKWVRYRLLCQSVSLLEQVKVAQEMEEMLQEAIPQLPKPAVEFIDLGYAEGETLAREKGCL